MQKNKCALTGEDFAAAVEGLIAEARAKGLPDITLLVEIEDIASQLRERLDDMPLLPRQLKLAN